MWEPEPTGDGDRFVPAGLDFAGRPQLAAVLPGSGGGRSILLNGHIDAVDVEPRDQWLSDPFVLTERDGYLFGRGANDMKGGIAGLVIALETLHRQGVRLAGDVVFCTVTDEESSGAGGRAAVAHGVKADAGIAAEATDFDAWVSCRGTVTPTITVAGRAGHAEMPQPDWRDGGAVNAIEKLVAVLNGMGALREEWKARPDHVHPLLAPGDIVPTIVHGGTWMVTIPASCAVTADVTYLPQHVDAEGTGKAVEAEVIDRLTQAVAGDPWFAEHPLQFAWSDDVVPAEMPADHPLVTTALGCAAALGHRGRAGRPEQLARRGHLHARRHADLQLRPGRHRDGARRQRARQRRRARRLQRRRRAHRVALVWGGVMIVHMSVHTPKPGREQDLIESMHRYGAAAAGQPGFVDAKTLRDHRTGRLVGHRALGGRSLVARRRRGHARRRRGRPVRRVGGRRGRELLPRGGLSVATALPVLADAG